MPKGLRAGHADLVLRAVTARPGTTQRDVARQTGLTERIARTQLDHLLRAGRIRGDRRADITRYFPGAFPR